MPVPTTRALWLAALSLVPAAVALLSPSIAVVLIAFDVALVVLIAIDFFLAPRVEALQLRRIVEPVLSSGRVNIVRLEQSMINWASVLPLPAQLFPPLHTWSAQPQPWVVQSVVSLPVQPLPGP